MLDHHGDRECGDVNEGKPILYILFSFLLTQLDIRLSLAIRYMGRCVTYGSGSPIQVRPWSVLAVVMGTRRDVGKYLFCLLSRPGLTFLHNQTTWVS